MKTFTSQKLAEYFKIKVPSDHWITYGWGGAGQLYTSLGWLGHNGIDYGGDQAKVFAPFDGTIHKIRKTGSKLDAWWISVWSDQEVTIDGQRVRLQCTYIHCDDFFVNEGDHVTLDQHIAKTDNSGYPYWSSGPHLHFGVYPLYWTGTKWVTDSFNGYEGAIDPSPLFDDWTFDIDKFPEGQLIKELNNPKVYLMDGRKRRWFPSQGAFWLSGRAFKTSNIWQLPPFEIVKIPLGETMPDLPPEVKAEMASLYPNLLK